MDEPTVLCLHGLGRSGADWEGVRGGLGGYGRFCAPDLPRTAVDDLTAVLASLPAAEVIAGHSLGGILALRRAAASPATRALILSGSFLPIVTGGRSRLATVRGYVGHRAALARDLATREARPRPRRSTTRALRSLVRVGYSAEAFHRSARDVTARVLVVHGSDDHHVPVDFAIAAAARHPSWDLRILADAGHDAHVACPEQWLAVVRSWLDSLPEATRQAGGSAPGEHDPEREQRNARRPERSRQDASARPSGQQRGR